MILYRVAKLKYAILTELTEHGYGAAQYGARWNSADPALHFNRHIIYSSDALAQAMLELIVHTDTENLKNLAYGYVQFEILEEYIAPLDTDALPENWNTHPASPSTQKIGDTWFDTNYSPILCVPSVIVPLSVYEHGHANYLINVKHPEIHKAVKILECQPISFDPRIKG